MIELMITLAILGIALAIGAPGFSNFINQNKISSATNSLVGALYSARSSSITRSSPTIVCPSTNAANAAANCGANASWNEGFIAFVDANDNGQRDAASDDESILLQVDAFENGVDIDAGTTFSDSVRFSGRGASTNAAGIPLGGTITVEYPGQQDRVITISSNGRVSSKVSE